MNRYLQPSPYYRASAERIVTPDGRAIGWVLVCSEGHRFTVDNGQNLATVLERHERATHRASSQPSDLVAVCQPLPER